MKKKTVKKPSEMNAYELIEEAKKTINCLVKHTAKAIKESLKKDMDELEKKIKIKQHSIDFRE
jgi:hypothetical protein